MLQSSAKSRVRGGIPWWLWLLMLVIGGGVVAATLTSVIPDDYEKYYQDALSGYEAAERAPMQLAIEKLEHAPAYARKRQMLQGMELMSLSRPLKAVPFLEEASQEPEIRAQSLAYLGQALARGDERLKAVGVLREAIQEDRTAPQPYLTLGGILYELGDFEGAIKELEVLLASDENKEKSSAHHLYGLVLFELEKYAEAAVQFQAGLTEDPANSANARIAQKLVVCTLNTQEFEKALKFLDSVQPTPMKEVMRAEALLGAGDLDAAVTAIETAIKAQFSDPAAYKVYGRIMLARGGNRAEEAMVALRGAIPVASRDVDFFRVIADVARAAGLGEEAESYEQNFAQLSALRERLRAQRDALQGELTDAAGRIEAGDLAAELQMTDLARFWYDAALRIDPQRSSVIAEKMSLIERRRPELVPVIRKATESPTTEPPATEPPATELPATELPATETPATETPATETPEIGRAHV